MENDNGILLIFFFYNIRLSKLDLLLIHKQWDTSVNIVHIYIKKKEKKHVGFTNPML